MSNLMTTCLLVLAITSMLATADDPQPFKITTNRDNDRVAVGAEKAKVIFTVHSPFGVNNATIERAGEKWPAAVVLRLHLKGMTPAAVFVAGVSPRLPTDERNGALTTNLPPA